LLPPFSISSAVRAASATMAGKLMHALQYSGYGGGAAALKVSLLISPFVFFNMYWV